jgi:hypothetical protein
LSLPSVASVDGEAIAWTRVDIGMAWKPGLVWQDNVCERCQRGAMMRTLGPMLCPASWGGVNRVSCMAVPRVLGQSIGA